MPPCASNGRRRLPACLVLALLVLTRAGFISGLQPNENRDSSVADIAMPSRPSLGSLQPVLDDGQFSARELQQFDMVPLLPFSPPPSPSPSPSPSPVETSPSPVTYQAPSPSPPTEGQNTALYIALGAGIGGALLLGAGRCLGTCCAAGRACGGRSSPGVFQKQRMHPPSSITYMGDHCVTCHCLCQVMGLTCPNPQPLGCCSSGWPGGSGGLRQRKT